MRTYRIVHWGTGNVGSLVLPAMLDRADFEIIGHYVHSPEKLGKDTGVLAGRDPIGLLATNDVDALIALRPDALVWLGNAMFDPLGTARLFARFLEAGINVVTCGLYEIGSRATTPQPFRDVLEPACAKGNASVFSGGADPGFAPTQFALATLAIAHRVDEIHMCEFADYGAYPDEAALRHFMGYGGVPGAETPLTNGDFIRRCWTSAVTDVATALGLTLDELQVEFEFAEALEDRDTLIGRIDKGTVSVIWFKLIGIADGKRRVFVDHVNWMHLDDLPAHWPQPPRYKGEVTGVGYRVELLGDPVLHYEIEMPGTREGLMATGLHAVNAIPSVVNAPAGIVDVADLGHYAPGPLK